MPACLLAKSVAFALIAHDLPPPRAKHRQKLYAYGGQ